VVARLETTGRASGERRLVAVGFVEQPDGSVLVAAGGPDTEWARNLEADPQCRILVNDQLFDATAEPIGGPEAEAAVRELILRYGTPAEGLGRGPAFRIRPLTPLPPA
jgi:deazaflavin-dependent oxidoreductase (nitroreductase family)